MSVRQKSVEILVVGNELLNGTTPDTNSFWLSKQLSKIAFIVRRKITVRDELQVISLAFRESISRKPDWIFSLGGLGPTFDDLTAEGLALALRKKLRVNPEAVRMLRESYRRRAIPVRGLSKARLKMATMPQDSKPLQNAVGSAPGVLAASGNTMIVLLPGVPREMRSIFSNELLPLLRSESFFSAQKWIKTLGISESQLSSAVSKLFRKYKSVLYIKSHPSGFEKGLSVIKIQIILTVPVQEKEHGLRALDEVALALESSARKLGATVSIR